MSETKPPVVKKPGFWSKLGNAAAELVCQLLYSGPR